MGQTKVHLNSWISEWEPMPPESLPVLLWDADCAHVQDSLGWKNTSFVFLLYSSCSHITKENFDKSDNIFLIDSWLMRNSLTTNFTKTAWDCEKMDTGKFLGDKKKMLTRWTKSSKRQKLVNTHWIKLVINNLTLSRHQKNLPFSCNIILWFQRTWATSVL